MRPCYHINEPGLGRILIPGCMGAAVYGKRGCTCGKQRHKDYLAELEDRIERLELAAIAGEARSGETTKIGSTGTASTRAARHRTGTS